jgi:2'-5' RNA ligase
MDPTYALVAYVRNPVGIFVENLRRDLHREHPELPAHITILPPRPLQGTEEQARRHIETVCREIKPFEIEMGDVETFAPATPTVFIRVARAAYRMRELHDKLNTSVFASAEPWPYMPHLTIVKLSDPEAAFDSAAVSRRRWAEFGGSRRILISELTFVRSGADFYTWTDLAPVRLGFQVAQETG